MYFLTTDEPQYKITYGNKKRQEASLFPAAFKLFFADFSTVFGITWYIYQTLHRLHETTNLLLIFILKIFNTFFYLIVSLYISFLGRFLSCATALTASFLLIPPSI